MDDGTENFARLPFTLAFVTGGARSGKSRRAEALASASGLERVYVATAEASDAEMAERIARHRADRGVGWRTVEAPREAPAALRAWDAPGRVLLLDCLTLWLSNLMLDGADPDAAGADLDAALAGLRGRAVVVSNEVGMGLVPETPLGRAFRDAQGRLNQRVAARADLALLAVSGLALRLK